jgi:plasmid replication initiation protein
MTRRRDPNSELDLFIPLLHDVPLKDQRETMERPFFSLQKRKRLKPIEYRSPDGDVWVKVEAMPAYGMATIWDADILIWAASALARMKAQGVNDLPRTLKTTTYDLLRAIKRDTGGKAYAELQAALQRLETTSIRTSLRAPTRRTEAQFGWLDGWTLEIDQTTGQPRGMTLTLSNWVYEGIVGDRSLLTMHGDYFLLTGGLERSLYRIARKHAGVQPEGWLCRLEILHTKTGSDSPSKEFNRMLRKVVERNQLPEYDLKLTTTQDGSPALFVISRLAAMEGAVTAELALLNERDGLAAPAGKTPPKTPMRIKARRTASATA